MRASFALALLLAVSGNVQAQGSAARWNPKAPENGRLLPGFSYGSVEPVLDAIGARHQRTSTDPSKPALLVTFANGRKVQMSLSACDGAGSCKAMSMQSNWAPIAGVPAERVAQSVATFNQRYAFAKAFVAANGRPSLQRYLTADYGYVRGNLAVDLLVYADQAQRFVTEVLQPLERAAR